MSDNLDEIKIEDLPQTEDSAEASAENADAVSSMSEEPETNEAQADEETEQAEHNEQPEPAAEQPAPTEETSSETHSEKPTEATKPEPTKKPEPVKKPEAEKPAEKPADKPADGAKPADKPADGKPKKPSKADKKEASAKKKQKAKLKKEWEDSIVASKRVKREEIRRKVKRATVVLLVFALVVTSVVYVMLLFMQENNVRITASNRGQDASIALSMDNKMWTPYLNASGPSDIWNVSYSPEYNMEKIDTVDDVRNMLNAASVSVGEKNGQNFIRFVFMVKNSGKYDSNLSYEMTLEYDKHGLQNSVRVMWGESYKSDELAEDAINTTVDVYAARSNNPRLAGTNINIGNSAEDGYLEYVAYPSQSNDEAYLLTDFESTFDNPAVYDKAVENGYFATQPFLNDNFVFQRHSVLPVGEIMYCYVCIWVEGSDFDCKDTALGGYVKMGINFVAY